MNKQEITTEPDLVPTNSVDDKSSKEFIGIVPPTASLFTPTSSLGVEDTSVEPVAEEEEKEKEEEESEYDVNEENQTESPYFTGYDRMDLTLTPRLPLSKQPLSVHLCLYRIQTKENNPYLEFVLQKHASNQQFYFPSVEPDSLTEGSASASATFGSASGSATFGSDNTALKNSLLTHIEVLLGKTSTDYPLFHGYETYQDKVIAFYNLTDYADSSDSPGLEWFLVNELVNPSALDPFVVDFFKEHPLIRTLYTTEHNREVELPTPLIVYHSSPFPLRQVDPTFGYVYKLVGTESNDSHPYILFPPPLNKTFFLLKKEFQEIAVESLTTYHDAFISNECIRYVEKGITVWIVKDVLAFYRRELDKSEASTVATDTTATVSFFPAKTTTSSLTNSHVRTESTRSKTPSTQLQTSTYPSSTHDYDVHASRLLNPGKNRSFQGV